MALPRSVPSQWTTAGGLIAAAARLFLEGYTNLFRGEQGKCQIIWLPSGAASPEGVVAAEEGSLAIRRGGGAGATLYVKETGSGNTGWSAK